MTPDSALRFCCRVGGGAAQSFANNDAPRRADTPSPGQQ
jgi:hypothetical protein